MQDLPTMEGRGSSPPSRSNAETRKGGEILGELIHNLGALWVKYCSAFRLP